ncbi:MAG: hypothetical protein ACI4OZ_05165 [Akkermansia sp.]
MTYANYIDKYPAAAKDIIITIAQDPQSWFELNHGQDPVQLLKGAWCADDEPCMSVPDDDLRELYKELTLWAEPGDFEGEELNLSLMYFN